MNGITASICFTIIICSAIAAATYLILNDAEWWALLILMVGGSVSFKVS